jgi:C-terminal processing protease CtpA/Prc
MAEDDKMKDTAQQISALIGGLGAEKFEQREVSQAKLIELGANQYELVLQKCLESHVRIKDPEIRFRIKNVLRPLVIKHNFMQKGFIGVSMQQNRVSQKIGDEVFLPIEIVSVIPDFPADKGGFTAGDLILKVDGNTCNEKFQTTEIVNYISAKKPGTAMTFLLQSNEKQIIKELVIAERPAMPNEPTIEEQQDEFFRNWLRVNLKKAGKNQ